MHGCSKEVNWKTKILFSTIVLGRCIWKKPNMSLFYPEPTGILLGYTIILVNCPTCLRGKYLQTVTGKHPLAPKTVVLDLTGKISQGRKKAWCRHLITVMGSQRIFGSFQAYKEHLSIIFEEKQRKHFKYCEFSTASSSCGDYSRMVYKLWQTKGNEE